MPSVTPASFHMLLRATAAFCWEEKKGAKELAIKKLTVRAPIFVQLLKHSYLQHGRQMRDKMPNTIHEGVNRLTNTNANSEKGLCSMFCDCREALRLYMTRFVLKG